RVAPSSSRTGRANSASFADNTALPTTQAITRRTRFCYNYCSRWGPTVRILSRPGDGMKTLISKYGSLFAFCALVLTFPTWAAAKKLNVVTTTTDLAALAQEVGGDKINVESMAKGYQDPHFVEAKPSFLLRLRQTDLLVVVGLQLEIGWLPPLITQSGNSR